MKDNQALRDELSKLENDYAEAFQNDLPVEELKKIFVRIKEIQKQLGEQPNYIPIRDNKQTD